MTRIYAIYYTFNSQNIDFKFLRNLVDGATHFNYQLSSLCREALGELNKYEYFNTELSRILAEDEISGKEKIFLEKLLN